MHDGYVETPNRLKANIIHVYVEQSLDEVKVYTLPKPRLSAALPHVGGCNIHIAGGHEQHIRMLLTQAE